jgi:hypothetical protein
MRRLAKNIPKRSIHPQNGDLRMLYMTLRQNSNLNKNELPQASMEIIDKVMQQVLMFIER